jgi:hypothetical protein
VNIGSQGDCDHLAEHKHLARALPVPGLAEWEGLSCGWGALNDNPA